MLTAIFTVCGKPDIKTETMIRFYETPAEDAMFLQAFPHIEKKLDDQKRLVGVV
ncbi:MAG: hypothetical protein LUC99_10445 [Clostridiales bacterium]|nr:hypothetical protein [Clostridiales bacterium]